MSALDDPPERDRSLAAPGVIDAHVHIFPPGVLNALWRWFETHAWPVRYRLFAEEIDAFLAARGVASYLALHYAHKPGMAESLNRFVLDFAKTHPRAIPVATVLPGEPDAEAILDRALTEGARAVKIHCHVQCVAPDEPRMEAVYRQVLAHDALLVIHCGNEPATDGYACDVRQFTVESFRRGLRRFPELKVVVPHFGSGEIAAYGALLEEMPNLYLDTAMMLSSFFDNGPAAFEILERHPERVLYGTDFPQLPYAWDRDLRAIEGAAISAEAKAMVLGGTAKRLLKL
jgi:predicted TIM-barrel fold metal-dependent hydrolase